MQDNSIFKMLRNLKFRRDWHANLHTMYVYYARFLRGITNEKARWKTRGRGPGLRGPGVWKTRGRVTIFFAKIWIVLTKMRSQSFVSL